MSSMQNKKGNTSLDSTKEGPTIQVSTVIAPRAEAATPLQREDEGRKNESLAVVTPMTKESKVLLAQFSLTRAEIGSFRQLKTSTREKDYCACIFEQQQGVEGDDEVGEMVSEALKISASIGSDEATLHQSIPRSSRSSSTTTTSTALPVSAATTTTSCLSYLDSSPSSQGSSTTSAVSTTSPSSSPPRHYRRRSSTFSTAEEQQQQIGRRRFSPSRRPITAWLCLACGGPALELPQRWIKRISYTASTRLLRISICDSAFSSYEGVSWRSSYKSAMRCEDPTNGELCRVRTIDLCLSRLVDPKEVENLLASFPSDLTPPLESPSVLPSPLPQLHRHLQHSKLWGGGGREVSCSPLTDCSPKMSPLGMLSPSLSEDTVWLSSSGGGTPDHFSRPYHQHPQQQVLTDAATDLMMRQQQQEQRHSNDAHDDDLEDSRNGLGRAVDDGHYFGSINCSSSSNSDASASIMAMLMMNHSKPHLSSPAVEKYQHPHFTPSQQQLYQQQQQQSLQFFAQWSVCPQSNPLGQDGAHNMLIQGIETCRGRVANSRPHQHRRSESDSGDLLVDGGGGFLSHEAEAQITEQQQVFQGARGKNQHGRRYCLQPQQQQNRQQQQQQQQYQQGSGNGGTGQRLKDQKRFSTSYQQKNFHHNQHHHHQQSYEVVVSTSQDQHNVASSPVVVQQASAILVPQPKAVSEAILLQAPVSNRRRCISSGDFDPDPIAPIMPPSICSALRRHHARRMSCDGRLETCLTSILESRSSQPASESNVAATVKVSVSSQSNSHRLQRQQQCSNQNQSQNAAGRMQQIRGCGRTQGPLMMKEQTDAQYRSKRHSLTISTDFPKDSLRDTAMSSVSDAGSDRRASISSSISDISISLSHSTTLSSSSSSTSLSSSSSNGVCTRKGGPPVHYTLMCWIGGRWPCKLRPLIKKSALNDIHIMLRRNLKLAPSYFIDIEFEWQGQTYMIMDATHWQWAREQVQDGDMAIRCKIWQKRFAR
ncbi:hypothetical protein EC957_001999 [Mortierella hygrophila]|uniref:Uncharacterized protein n=1 Tax=Mortierella hygrophila TaxID=979708 RepID=A0A9P6FFZ3_9FUNG|nr:hypothetical protein EC957_001999 [Mortierella hygrophila]